MLVEAAVIEDRAAPKAPGLPFVVADEDVCAAHRVQLAWGSERDGDLIRLPEAMWTPFLEGNNRAIEEGHASGAERASIALGPRRLAVAFTQGPESMFALQRDDEVLDALNTKGIIAL